MNIIACGPTGELWDGTGPSIGVNDCWKFGNTTDRLIVVNTFAKEHERQKFIADCRPQGGFYSNLSRWKYHPNYKELNIIRYTKGDIRLDKIYHSATSSFIAMSMAATLGFKEIVIYGVDFTNHRVIKDYILMREIELYDRFVKALEKHGVKVYLASNYGALKDTIPVRQYA